MVQENGNAIITSQLDQGELLSILIKASYDLSKELALRHHCDNPNCDIIPVSHAVIRFINQLDEKYEKEEAKKE